MRTKTVAELNFLLCGLSVYRGLQQDPVIDIFIKLTSRELRSAGEAAKLYGELFNILCDSKFKCNMADYIYDKVLYAENLFTLACAKDQIEQLPLPIIAAARQDLSVLSQLAYLDSSMLKAGLTAHFPEVATVIQALPEYQSRGLAFKDIGDWGDKIDLFAEYTLNNGYGKYGRFPFFYLNVKDGEIALLPVKYPDPVDLKSLKNYEVQQRTILENTAALIHGNKVNNILLYGDRGTGKSSTVKAIVNRFASSGLRLVEVSKANLKYLGRVIDMLAKLPMKFIIFIDDLTFAEGDDSYTAMKAVLEGSTTKLGDNMVLYATTNRRHLVAESFSSRNGDAVHIKDTLDETASLSDRFGITLTFTTPSQNVYLEILKKLADDEGVTMDEDELTTGALTWATRRGSFSPRSARQYLDNVKAIKLTGIGDILSKK